MPSLSSAVPRWFTKIESVLGLGGSSSHARMIVLPPLLCPAVPNPFRSSLLPFAPIAARVDDFVIAFPTSFPDDGNYFLAQLVGWENSAVDSVVSYHLQHWHDANEYDDPGGVLLEGGYFVQCGGDCEAPQPCESCGVGCCW